MTTIEKVARAIWMDSGYPLLLIARDGEDATWEGWPDDDYTVPQGAGELDAQIPGRDHFRSNACKAIAALLPPSPEMVEAMYGVLCPDPMGLVAIDHDSFSEGLTAAIQSILGEDHG